MQARSVSTAANKKDVLKKPGEAAGEDVHQRGKVGGCAGI